MLKIYLSTVLIWMIVIFCSAKLFASSIKKNGWLDDAQSVTMGKWTTLFVTSAVPLLRLLVLACIVYMAVSTKEDFEKIQNEHKKDD